MLRNMLVAIIFGAAAIVGVWDLLQIEAFDNALMQFVTAGVIPGTGVVLTPGQVYALLCTLLLAVICLTFRRSLVRDWREFKRTAFSRPAPVQPVSPAIAANLLPSEPAPASVVELAAKPMVEPPAQPVVAASRPAVIITIPATPGALVRGARSFTAWLRPAVAHGWQLGKTRSRNDIRQLTRLAAHAARQARMHAVRMWRYTEPRIRDLDSRIERRLKRNPTVARVLYQAGYIYKQVHARVNAWRGRPVEK